MKIIFKYVAAFLLMAGMMLSCNNLKDSGDVYEDSREIYHQAIEIHDEVMPKMGYIMQLQKSLKATRDNLADENVKIQVDSAINELENAYDRMMTWMRNIPRIPEYNPNGNPEEMKGESLPDPGELKKSQQASLEEIKKVKVEIHESIDHAEKLLESLKGT
jgi:hypothetical protein